MKYYIGVMLTSLNGSANPFPRPKPVRVILMSGMNIMNFKNV